MFISSQGFIESFQGFQGSGLISKRHALAFQIAGFCEEFIRSERSFQRLLGFAQLQKGNTEIVPRFSGIQFIVSRDIHLCSGTERINGLFQLARLKGLLALFIQSLGIGNF